MTKREIIKWLEEKWHAVEHDKWQQYYSEQEARSEETLEQLGLPAIADQIESHLAAALQLWLKWKSENIRAEGISFPTHNRLESDLSHYTSSKGDTLKALNDRIAVKTAAIQTAASLYDTQRENICNTYRNVIATVKSMRSTKEAAEYLKTLGFELSEMEKPAAPVTALSTQINTNYLFLEKAA